MSDVLIGGMEMPYGCANCHFVNGPVYDAKGRANYFCNVDVEEIRGKDVTREVIALYAGAAEAFPTFCPLIEIKTPHGDFVDRNYLLSEYDRQHNRPPGGARKIIEKAPAVCISEEYARAVRNWLVNYQVKCADLAGRYTPYEVLGWIVSDWRKENGIW